MSTRHLAFAVLCLAGCHKSPAPGGGTGELHVTGDAADTLWNLAPDSLAGGIVIAPGAVALIDPILDRLRAFATDPEFAGLEDSLKLVATVLGSDTAHLADAGFATDKGTAFFQTDDGALIGILPMANRDKLVAARSEERA